MNSIFSYASSSTPHPCQWVGKWAEFRTSVASRLASLFREKSKVTVSLDHHVLDLHALCRREGYVVSGKFLRMENPVKLPRKFLNSSKYVDSLQDMRTYWYGLDRFQTELISNCTKRFQTVQTVLGLDPSVAKGSLEQLSEVGVGKPVGLNSPYF